MVASDVSGPRPGEPSAPFLRACWSLPVDRTPVWFMRQAGRFLPEYRAIREQHSLLEICEQPDLAAQVALLPVQQLGVDAAILFADILLPLIPMGIDLKFSPGEGPVIHNPVRSSQDIARLRAFQPEEELAHVMEAIRILRGELPSEVPLIGFAGAPFTVASYMVEGGPSRHHLATKSLMLSEPKQWHRLMEKLTDVISAYLLAQVRAGAQAIQLFDSWVGALSPEDYCQFVKPHSASILQSVAETGVPRIHFGTGTGSLLEAMQAAGGDVIGLDWRTPLDQAWQRLGPQVAIQGNLDPAALLAPLPVLEGRVLEVLRRAGGRPGHIFNLGHGIYPQTPVENARAVVEIVHAHRVKLALNSEA
ncbi:MAG: uroporphyrinogen decarboxylase [Anaerolineales bacterium]